MLPSGAQHQVAQSTPENRTVTATCNANRLRAEMLGCQAEMSQEPDGRCCRVDRGKLNVLVDIDVGLNRCGVAIHAKFLMPDFKPLLGPAGTQRAIYETRSRKRTSTGQNCWHRQT